MARFAKNSRKLDCSEFKLKFANYRLVLEILIIRVFFKLGVVWNRAVDYSAHA